MDDQQKCDARRLILASMYRIRLQAREAMANGPGFAFFICPPGKVNPGENEEAKALRDACAEGNEPWVSICSTDQIISGFDELTIDVDDLRRNLEMPIRPGTVRVCVFNDYVAIADLSVAPMDSPTKGMLS